MVSAMSAVKLGLSPVYPRFHSSIAPLTAFAYDNGITAVQALMNGQVDCVVIDSAPAAELVAANTGLTILPTEYVVEDYAIGVAKENVALLDAINEVLAQMQADGTMQSIIDQTLQGGYE